MANRSSDFLDIDEPDRALPLQRSRSGGYADYLEEKTRWDRRDRERHMKRYHDSHLSPIDAQPQPSGGLYVPAFAPSHRRSRSHEHIEVRAGEPPRTYRVREAVPARLSEPAATRAWTDDLARRPSLKQKEKETDRQRRSRRPSIKVQIHQDAPPPPPPQEPATPRRTPTKSPNASPRSAGALPQLEFQVAALMSRLRIVGTACAPYVDVEAARAQDLTFGEIAERCRGFRFELEVWSRVVRVEEMARIDPRKRVVVEAAARTLDRMIERVAALGVVCGRLRPEDLRVRVVPAVDSDDQGGDSEDEGDDGNGDLDAVFESPAFIVQEHLNSIQTQIQTLKRLSRTLQEATPAAEEEVVAIESIVAEVGRSFDSKERLDRHWGNVY